MMVVCFCTLSFSQSLVKWEGNWQCNKMLDEHTIVVFNGNIEKTVRIKAGEIDDKDYIPMKVFTGNYCDIYTQRIDKDGVPIVMIFENGVYANDYIGEGIVFENNVDNDYSLSGATSTNSQKSQTLLPANQSWFSPDEEFNKWVAKWRTVRQGMSPEQMIQLLGQPSKSPNFGNGHFHTVDFNNPFSSKFSPEQTWHWFDVQILVPGEIMSFSGTNQSKSQQLDNFINKLMQNMNRSFFFTIKYDKQNNRWKSSSKSVTEVVGGNVFGVYGYAYDVSKEF
jgi:hypothetical protein